MKTVQVHLIIGTTLGETGGGADGGGPLNLKALNQGNIKYILSKSGFILKTVATLVIKSGLIWQQGGFLL